MQTLFKDDDIVDTVKKRSAKLSNETSEIVR